MFILLTPMRNEADQIDELVRCVTGSKFRPDLWLIIDDCSDDRTPQKLSALAREYDFVRIHRIAERASYMGYHISEILINGLKQVQAELQQARYVGVLDADIRFGPSYWQRLKEYLDRNPKAGIVSGTLCAKDDQGRWKIEPFQRVDNPRGGLRLVKKACFDDIGGIRRSRAWDPVMNVKARVRGWQVAVLPDVFAASSRATDARFTTAEGEFSRGQRDYHLHHPAHQIVVRAVAKALKKRPSAGWHYLKGYFSEWKTGGRRFPDDDVRRYYRRERTREWLRTIVSLLTGKENPHRFIPVRIVTEDEIFR
ncbi:MAG TPA: glycosyltransferase family 2 protein [Caldithrix abyssi]|uniref:Glycosyltransferase family 2 protein n=1 Tax=Caldithrix abyssi TaxID=187145 RepID=A0A7V5PNV4_CALAY|nr:glycosyltransferase family 2 protein [Caldithrix abyssi]